jgi:membrane-bound lytic murein transglycosylase D
MPAAGSETEPVSPPPPALPASGAAAEAPADEAAPPAAPLPRFRLDPDQDAERTSLWDRIRNGYSMPDLDGELVQRWEQYYARQPDYVQRMAERGALYLFHIVEEVERRQMPAELALLPFIESAFNPQALSRARASGMWQFMPATGKDFELHQNLFRDDRRDVLASTNAALDYLQRLHTMFGDWHLALAAYNWGQGNVQRAIQRNRAAGRATDYTSLNMPAETRNYVPKLQAMKNIVGSPQRLGLTLPPLENHPYFLSVPIERDIDVALAARLAGLPLDQFQALNPQLNKPVILAAGTPQVLLPYDNANHFVRELNNRRGPLASWTAWVAPRTLKPAEAAQMVGTSEATLRQANNIPARMLVQRGSTLLVPRSANMQHDVSEHLADSAVMRLSPDRPPLRRVTFKAGRGGDSVAAVAKRYRVSAALVAQWNNTTPQAHFKPGQNVVVMAAPAARKVARAGAARKTVPQATQRQRVARAR